MNINLKSAFKKTALALALINLFSFLVYYVTTVTLPNQITAYIKMYYEEITDVILPLLVSAIVYVIYTKFGAKAAVISTLLFSLTWFLYFFPYYAFEYAFRGAYIDEVFYYSALAALIAIAIELLKTTILFFVILFFARLKAKRIMLSKKKYVSIVDDTSPLDFSSPVAVGIFAASFTVFLYKLGFEIYSTISFIIENSYSNSLIQTGEILYIAVRYVFILALLFIAHFGAFAVKNRIMSVSVIEAELPQKKNEEETKDDANK